MKNFLNSLLDYIYKKKCYFCGKSKESVKMCSSCFDEMAFLPTAVNRDIDGIKIYCSGIYEKNLQKLIRGLKYHKQKSLAFYQAKFMYLYWKNIQNKAETYQVIPVPLYKSREKHRTYNHMALVGEEFCKLTGYELNLKAVSRVKDTKPQYKLSRPQRLKNLSDAFRIDKTKLSTDRIMLIDDICTTGSTFESIIKEFQKKGIKNIVGFATTTPFENQGGFAI